MIFLLSLFMLVSISFPIIMIGAPYWVTFIPSILLLLSVMLPYIDERGKFIWFVDLVTYGYDVIRPILYIWAIIVTVQGKQDAFAIILYVATVIQAPGMIKSFIGAINVIKSMFSRN